MTSIPVLKSACVILLFAASARADVRWNLTTSDFQTRPINLLAIDQGVVRFIDKQSIEQTVPLDQFVGMQEMTTVPRPAPAKLMVFLSTGAKLSGEITSLKDEKLTFKSPLVGEMTFPLKQVLRMETIAKAGAIKKTSPSKTEDVLQLTNGDSVTGVVDSISPTTITIKTAAGPSDVPLESIAAVIFAESGDSTARPTKGYRLLFDDGSNLVVDMLTVQGSNVTVTLAGGANRSFDLDKLSSIEQLNGPVCWLSSLVPSENVQTPFLEATLPPRMDKSVMGDPIRFGPQVFARGIGVHSRSHLTWEVDGTYKSFRTQYAIAADLPYADVDVRILLDGKVVHEAKGVKAKFLSPVVILDLGAAKTITLEVDFGQGYDVQDRLNWIEPALLRSAAPPATQP